jgi:signal transduction histidine kinase
LTNAYRHGRASAVDIVVGIRGRNLYIRISDNGIGGSKLVPGNGLTGMKERVNHLGGSIVWQTMPHKGFDIGVRIPLAAEEAG